jgi:hypothetical protein
MCEDCSAFDNNIQMVAQVLGIWRRLFGENTKHETIAIAEEYVIASASRNEQSSTNNMLKLTAITAHSFDADFRFVTCLLQLQRWLRRFPRDGRDEERRAAEKERTQQQLV